MEAFLEALKAEIKCSLCQTANVELKILKCLHVLCENCLAHIELQEDGKALQCPSCREITTLDQPRDLSSVRTSQLHLHISKVLSNVGETNSSSGSQSLPSCSCKKQNPAISYCSTCLLWLCEHCSEGHDMFTQGHKVLSLTEVRNQQYRVVFQQPSFCENPLHMKELMTFYCNTCKRSACPKCLSEHYADKGGMHDHDIVTTEANAEMKRKTLLEKLKELEEKTKQEQHNLRCLDELVYKSRKESTDAKAHVTQASNELIAFIKESERDLFKKIDEKVQENVTLKEELQLTLQQIAVAKQHVQTQIECAPLSLSEMPSVARLDELIGRKTNLGNYGYFQIQFIPSGELYALQQASLGKIQSHTFLPLPTYIEMDNPNFLAFAQEMRQEAKPDAAKYSGKATARRADANACICGMKATKVCTKCEKVYCDEHALVFQKVPCANGNNHVLVERQDCQEAGTKAQEMRQEAKPETAYSRAAPKVEMKNISITRSSSTQTKCDFCTIEGSFMCDKCLKISCEKCLVYFDTDLCEKDKGSHHFKDMIGMTGSLETWACERCTFVNEPEYGVCTVCATSRGVTGPQFPVSGSRKCSHCTYGNEEGAKVCVMCNKTLDQSKPECYI